MTGALKNRIWSGYLIAFLLLSVSYFLIFFIVRKLSAEADGVSHTYTVLNNLEKLKGNITDAETGARGYVITKDIRFLTPYENSLKDVPKTYNTLHALMQGNSSQLQKLDTLNRLLNKRLDFISTGLAEFKNNGFVITDDMKAKQELTKNTMDSTRLYITKMKNEEESLMLERKTKLSNFFSNTVLITIASLVIAVITLLYSIILYQRQSKAREISDKKADQYGTELQELKRIEKFAATGRIARTIAHEVRNPLTNIALATEQLQEMATTNPDSTMLLEMVSRNANRINQLVSDLLNATRFVQLIFTEIDVNQLVDETLEMARDRIELKHIKIEKDYSNELCNISVDAEKIKLALLNIIVNAIEAMEKEKGVLLLKTKKQGSKCIIEIKDNGVGMDDDTLQKLFEPYFTAKSDGNGLGLTNTQNIILNHGGNIKVYSKPGEGTSFQVILNIADNEAEKLAKGNLLPIV